MSTHQVGMSYSDVSTRCKRILRNPGNVQAKVNLINSLQNQCRLAEGEKAINELNSELFVNPSSRSFTGAGHKQLGVCMKFDCKNRDVKCDECYRLGNYEKV